MPVEPGESGADIRRGGLRCSWCSSSSQGCLAPNLANYVLMALTLYTWACTFRGRVTVMLQHAVILDKCVLSNS